MERDRRLHGTRASNKSILSNQPETHAVDAVFVHRHIKAGAPDSLCVTYRCGYSQYREWVCLDHPDFAGRRAQAWWNRRFSVQRGHRVTITEALNNLFLSQELLDWTKTVTVRKNGRHWEVISYNDSTDTA
jgi:hypothetical protein